MNSIIKQSLELETSLEKLNQLFSGLWQRRKKRQRTESFPLVHAGIETRSNPREYYWDGQKRVHRSQKPIIIFQYTLSGFGAFSENQKVFNVRPGEYFCCRVPSSHTYYLPRNSKHWRFFWFITTHPYVVERISRVIKGELPIRTLNPNDKLMIEAVKLFELVCLNPQRTDLDEEQVLFTFMLNFERLYREVHMEGEIMLEELRRAVMNDLENPFNVEHFASVKKMSRSYFTQIFSRKTGMRPAHYIRKTRLLAAENKLLNSTLSINEIATNTGFANATHFCKVFRQNYGVSPDLFRRQRSPPLEM